MLALVVDMWLRLNCDSLWDLLWPIVRHRLWLFAGLASVWSLVIVQPSCFLLFGGCDCFQYLPGVSSFVFGAFVAFQGSQSQVLCWDLLLWGAGFGLFWFIWWNSVSLLLLHFVFGFQHWHIFTVFIELVVAWIWTYAVMQVSLWALGHRSHGAVLCVIISDDVVRSISCSYTLFGVSWNGLFSDLGIELFTQIQTAADCRWPCVAVLLREDRHVLLRVVEALQILIHLVDILKIEIWNVHLTVLILKHALILQEDLMMYTWLSRKLCMLFWDRVIDVLLLWDVDRLHRFQTGLIDQRHLPVCLRCACNACQMWVLSVRIRIGPPWFTLTQLSWPRRLMTPRCAVASRLWLVRIQQIIHIPTIFHNTILPERARQAYLLRRLVKLRIMLRMERRFSFHFYCFLQI